MGRNAFVEPRILRGAYALRRVVVPHTRVLILVHKNPDGDAIGSAVALSLALRQQGIQTVIACATAIPESYGHYCVGVSQARTLDEIRAFEPECVVCLDGGDADYVSLVWARAAIRPSATVCVVDHHASNTLYGQVNIVYPDIGSTAQILEQVFRVWGTDMTPDIAGALMLGVFNDTGALTNGATSAHAFAVSAHAVERGSSLDYVRASVSSRDIQTLRLIGTSLQKLCMHPQYAIATTWITRGDCEVCGLTPDHAGIATNFLNMMSSIWCSVMIKDDAHKGMISVSLRTTQNNVNCARLCALLGGGGHKKAAAFRIPGTITYTNNRVVIA